jgi:NADH:ubiquinone reductase (non-electrogenic)
MAARSRALRPLLKTRFIASPAASARFNHHASSIRALSSATPRSVRPAVATNASAQLLLRHGARRGYAEAGTPPPPPPPPPPLKRKRGVFRSVLLWSWRLTYVSLLGGLAYVGYGVYEMRFPVEQDEPDPTKKTLVVLGTFLASRKLDIRE